MRGAHYVNPNWLISSEMQDLLDNSLVCFFQTLFVYLFNIFCITAFSKTEVLKLGSLDPRGPQEVS